MKQPRHLFLLLGLCALALLAAPLAAADDGTEQSAGSDQAAMEEAMMKAMMPGEHHEWLAGMVGTWNAKMKMWMDPSAEPTESAGTVTRKMVMGGRYLSEDFEGTFNGMPFQGHGMTGFDNVSGKFIGTWIDNFGTGMMVSYGERDGDTLTTHADYPSPMTGEVMKIRMVTTMVDKDHIDFEYYMVPAPGAPEMKQMAIEYTRAAAE